MRFDNGDGHIDVVVVNQGSGSSGTNVLVLLGDGTGGLHAPLPFTVGTDPTSLVVGKFNGDNILDVAVLNRGSHSISILLGDGAGGFVTHATIAGGSEGIAAKLGLDGAEVEPRVGAVLEALGARSRLEALVVAARRGLLDLSAR